MAALDTDAVAPTAAIPPRPARSGRDPLRWFRGGGLTKLIFFLPLLLSFGLFSWLPIARSLVLSLQKTNFVETTWVGMSNFARVLADPLLPTAVWNTTYFSTLALIFGFPTPVLIAILIAEMRRTRQIASVLAYLPVIIPPVVAVLLWKAFYNPSPTGLFNTIAGWFGLGPFPWLNSGTMVIPSLVLYATWAGMGTGVIIYLATLMTVRTELYEAAEIDGAGILRRIWHITLPQLRNIMLVMLLLQLIGTFQTFTEPYIMTDGGPVNKSLTILLLIYRYGFVQNDFGKATALSLLLAIALAIMSALYTLATKRWSTS